MKRKRSQATPKRYPSDLTRTQETRQNKLSDSMPREDGVVPLAMELVPPDGQLLHLLVTHLPTCRIVARVQLRADGQPALRPRVPNQVHHHLTAHQGATPPVLGDVAEHAMLDLIPLARPRREVAHRDPQAGLIGQPL